jgi:hypothetical protein
MACLNYVICCILKIKYVIIFQDKYFFTFNNGLRLFFKNKSASSARRKAHYLPIKPSSKECEQMSCILTLYIRCIMFMALFIDQHLCIILCILDDILIISPMRFGVHWHHRQGAQFNFKFFETSNNHKHLLNTCYKITLFYTKYTNLNYHKNVLTEVYVYWNSWKFKPVFTQTAPLWISLKCLHWCVCL